MEPGPGALLRSFGAIGNLVEAELLRNSCQGGKGTEAGVTEPGAGRRDRRDGCKAEEGGGGGRHRAGREVALRVKCSLGPSEGRPPGSGL